MQVHVLQVSKVEMGATTMPESEIQRTGTGVQSCLSLLWNNCMTIQVPHIVLCDSSSEMKFTRMSEANTIILNPNLIAFEASEVE